MVSFRTFAIKHYYIDNERLACRIGDETFPDIDSAVVSNALLSAKQAAVNAAAPDSIVPDKFDFPSTLQEDSQHAIYWQHSDHLGSASWITDTAGRAIQHLQYMPWGEPLLDYRNSSFNTRYTFSGKERDEETGYSYFGARYYNSSYSIWMSVDPMSDKYPSLSPYAYCGNNPVKLVDPRGEEIGDFVANGVIIGNDGKDDGKLYVVNNRSISTKEYRLAKKFIKRNSGNTDAFEQNDIAYKNSTLIESSAENRQKMVDIVSQDDGTGGTSPNNNREYGGKYDENGKIIPLPPGDVGDLSKTDQLNYDPSNIFHSHASGSLYPTIDLNEIGTTIGREYNVKRWTQEPSPSDMKNCNGRTRYVFGMGNKTVYIYNQSGVQATMPIDRFVHPIK